MQEKINATGINSWNQSYDNSQNLYDSESSQQKCISITLKCANNDTDDCVSYLCNVVCHSPLLFDTGKHMIFVCVLDRHSCIHKIYKYDIIYHSLYLMHKTTWRTAIGSYFWKINILASAFSYWFHCVRECVNNITQELHGQDSNQEITDQIRSWCMNVYFKWRQLQTFVHQ